MDKDYLPFHPSPSKPHYVAPDGAVDAHCHVFGPGDQFPYSPKRKYTPCDASKEQLFALRDHLGFARNVIVQASCHGTDNAALLDALETAGDLARGVAVVSPDITEQELQHMHDMGVRGVRFNFVKRLVDTTPKEVFLGIAEKIRPFGWHIVVYFEAQDFDDIAPFLLELDTQIVIDHMGRPDVALGVEHPNFQKFAQLLADNPHIWTKVSCPERLTQTPPDYSDVVPFARYLVEHFPNQVLWGTDWPHPNMKSHMPDDGHLVDVIPHIAPTEALQQTLLVTNPMKLYWK
ncbi:amidohydrolase family protein [Vibrio fluvialis]|uniref:amidohydrolase family protein n=1 Tax=Vibrio fluvialis TaxID=676 RepID=UPI001F42B26F|nr:amidohydrolase family protein [Vibrio fluvialis]EMC0408170.1 amidohydrolase family protein [Vibrio fluvialis]MCE7614808.1 amidohydrolase family protein [Vibrio fluvialis]